MAGNQNNYGQYSAAQPYIQYLQNEINRLQNQLNNIVSQQNQNSQPQQQDQSSGISLPVRHADIIQVKDKNMVLKEKVEPEESKIFMTEEEDTIYIKHADEHNNVTLYTYTQQEPENVTNDTDFVTKADLKSMLDEAIHSFSDLVPKADSFVRKDEIRDIIVETLSSSRGRKKEEE